MRSYRRRVGPSSIMTGVLRKGGKFGQTHPQGGCHVPFVVLCSGSSGQLKHLGSAELGFEPESFDLGACHLSMHQDISPRHSRGEGRGVLLSRWLEEAGHRRKRWGVGAAAGKSSPNTSPSPACLPNERAKRIQRVLGSQDTAGPSLCWQGSRRPVLAERSP